MAGLGCQSIPLPNLYESVLCERWCPFVCVHPNLRVHSARATLGLSYSLVSVSLSLSLASLPPPSGPPLAPVWVLQSSPSFLRVCVSHPSPFSFSHPQYPFLLHREETRRSLRECRALSIRFLPFRSPPLDLEFSRLRFDPAVFSKQTHIRTL